MPTIKKVLEKKPSEKRVLEKKPVIKKSVGCETN
jgi:hypothetical protein